MKTKKIKKEEIIKAERERERERSSKNKIIVWALYDDSRSSYKNALKEYFKNLNIECYSIGINDIKFKERKKFFYKKIDLSLTNFNLIKELKQLPHPDVILASPPCESWSGADCDGRMIRSFSEDGVWKVKNYKFYEKYNKKAHPVKRRHFKNKEIGRLIGEATIGATILIIKTFKPKVWVIENPKTSKTWEFQKNHWGFNDGYLNDTYYSSYDPDFSLKPTIFKSNIKLNLKKDRGSKSNKNHMALGSYSKRSSIPSSLIEDMFSQIISKIKE